MKKVFVILAALAMTATMAFAQQQIGTIDGARASQAYWKQQAGTKSLTEENQRLQELQQQIKGSIEQLSSEVDAAKQASNDPVLSQEKRDAAKKEAEDKTQQAMQYQTSFQMQVQRFQRRQQELQAEIESDILASVRKVSAKNNLDLVLLSQVAPYAKIDITDQVIEDLNSTQPKEAAPVAAPSAK